MQTLRKLVVVLAVAVGMAGAALAQEKPAPAAGQEKDKPAAAADPVTGEWEGTVDMPDGALPFSLTLKLDQGKVTGEIGSQQGTVPITEGSFADGKLTLSFTYVDGNGVALIGAFAEGQFTGSLNYGGGQMVTNWAAKKKVAK